PICTASRQYQNLKIKQLQEQGLNQEEYQEQFNIITEKACLCEGLATAAYINNDIVEKNESTAVAICPGPNTAYFNKIYSLNDMVKHIYGKINLLDGVKRSNMYINELHLYIEYIKKDINHSIKNLNDKKIKYYNKFKEQLENGITYYKNIIPQIFNQSEAYKKQMLTELDEAVNKINQIFSILSNTEEKQTKVA
ncbi:MAG TPA: hypothetical protein PLH33_10285, partial [Chitinophagaceae bacterium]|nr:hypothetical protein [Chitinophagaceae bacterium]